MYGPIDKKDKIKFGIVDTPLMSLRPAKTTEYLKLSSDRYQTIGITHHETGLGKLKMFDKKRETEFAVTIYDILNKPLKDWKIDKK
jgi:DNA-directed RNA polymerase subunit E'/Rpb7